MTSTLAIPPVALPAALPEGCLQRYALALPPQLSLEQTAAVYDAVMEVGEANAWWKGDIQVYGFDTHGEAFSQVLDGQHEKSLAIYRRVCQRFPPAERFPLSFGHHQAVVRFEAAEDRRAWLQRALDAGWSVRQLRDALREADLTEQGLLGRPLKPLRVVIDRKDILLSSSCRVGLVWRPQDHERLRQQLGLPAPPLDEG